MSSTFNTAISPENIKVAYVNPYEGLIDDVSIEDANTYSEANPDTIFIFVDGDNNIKYLTIDEVNKLTPNDLVSTKSLCDTASKPCGPPRIQIYGGGGIGAKANPIISPGGAIMGLDIVDGGYGYKTPPLVQIIDDCNTGSGAVIETEIDRGRVISGIVKDTLYLWEKDPDKPEFSDALYALRLEQEDLLLTGAIQGKFRERSSLFILSSVHGYVERKEEKLTVEGTEASLEQVKALMKAFNR